LVFGFTGCSIGFLAEIVLKSIAKCLPFLFLLSLQDLFQSPVVNIRRRHVPDSVVLAPLVMELDELPQGRTKLAGARVHQLV
jgi:hypothetical protein